VTDEGVLIIQIIRTKANWNPEKNTQSLERERKKWGKRLKEGTWGYKGRRTRRQKEQDEEQDEEAKERKIQI